MSLITDPTRVEREMAADRTPTPAMTFDEWLQNELRNQPARILSWSNIWDAAHAQGRAEGVAVTGWRLLEEGEIIQAGDEAWSSNYEEWNSLDKMVGQANSLSVVRRRMTAAVDAAKERGE